MFLPKGNILEEIKLICDVIQRLPTLFPEVRLSRKKTNKKQNKTNKKQKQQGKYDQDVSSQGKYFGRDKVDLWCHSKTSNFVSRSEINFLIKMCLPKGNILEEIKLICDVIQRLPTLFPEVRLISWSRCFFQGKYFGRDKVDLWCHSKTSNFVSRSEINFLINFVSSQGKYFGRDKVDSCDVIQRLSNFVSRRENNVLVNICLPREIFGKR